MHLGMQRVRVCFSYGEAGTRRRCAIHYAVARAGPCVWRVGRMLRAMSHVREFVHADACACRMHVRMHAYVHVHMY